MEKKLEVWISVVPHAEGRTEIIQLVEEVEAANEEAGPRGLTWAGVRDMATTRSCVWASCHKSWTSASGLPERRENGYQNAGPSWILTADLLQ